MKTICYIVPYFGKLPRNFQLWLNSCKYNNNIDWLLFTNDRSEYKYPKNVKVHYCSFEYIKKIIQDKFDFKILIDSYWRLSLFKPAYGDIFEDYISEYDFWGHCDVDLMWGNIRKFLTNDILLKYEKIGFQGHSTLYKNTKEVNLRYKTIVPGKITYIDEFTGKTRSSFDENGMEEIYKYLKIPYYKKVNFAHLSKYEYSFYLWHLPSKESYKNRRQVFVWDHGNLTRYYLDKSNHMKHEEFMYIHFFCRPMTYLTDGKSKKLKYVMYPDILKELNENITVDYIKKYGKNSKLKYYVKSVYYNRKKLTIKKIIFNIKSMIKRRISKFKRRISNDFKK